MGFLKEVIPEVLSSFTTLVVKFVWKARDKGFQMGIL